jgi:hypothetical protein
MSVMVTELYRALKAAGVEDGLAQDAARSVVGIEHIPTLATKADVDALRLAVKADLSDLKADLIKWNVGAMAMLTLIYSAIGTALRFIRP